MIGRPRIEPELSSSKRDHGIAELGLALLLEGERVHRIDDHAGEPRGIERAFLEIEIPAAILLREQSPLEPVGEPRHRAVQRQELLVEKGAQAVELVGVA